MLIVGSSKQFLFSLRRSHLMNLGHAPKLKLLAFLSTSESAVSTGIFDCCVVPSAINVRNNTNTLDVCVTGYSLDKTTGSQEKVNTLSTTTSSNDYISSNSSLNSSPAQDEKDKF